jgi:hypothetical protein
MKNTLYKLVVYVPQTNLEAVRIALASSGAGKLGKYDHCAFISHGIGVYRPLKGSNPHKGEIGNLEREGEAKIEVTIEKKLLKKAVSAVKKIHPYEEPVIEIYELKAI